MSLRKKTLITTTVAAVSAALALTASATAPAAAKSAPSDARKLDSSVLAPFQIAVRGGTVWWTDGFQGTITRLRNGHKQVISRAGAEGVAVSGKKLAYTATPEKSYSRLVVRQPGRKAKVVEHPSLRGHAQPRRQGALRDHQELQPVRCRLLQQPAAR